MCREGNFPPIAATRAPNQQTRHVIDFERRNTSECEPGAHMRVTDRVASPPDYCRGNLCTFLVWFALLTLPSPPTLAQDEAVAAFYGGKTITILVGSDSGGGYDLNARLLARYMGKYIPGHPQFIVQNRPGASSSGRGELRLWNRATGRHLHRRRSTARSVSAPFRPTRPPAGTIKNTMAWQHDKGARRFRCMAHGTPTIS